MMSRDSMLTLALDIAAGFLLAAVFVALVKVTGMLTEAAVTIALVAGALALAAIVRRRAATVRRTDDPARRDPGVDR